MKNDANSVNWVYTRLFGINVAFLKIGFVKNVNINAGAYDSEADAARTYDLAALKYWGPETTLNFPVST